MKQNAVWIGALVVVAILAFFVGRGTKDNDAELLRTIEEKDAVIETMIDEREEILQAVRDLNEAAVEFIDRVTGLLAMMAPGEIYVTPDLVIPLEEDVPLPDTGD